MQIQVTNSINRIYTWANIFCIWQSQIQIATHNKFASLNLQMCPSNKASDDAQFYHARKK